MTEIEILKNDLKVVYQLYTDLRNQYQDKVVDYESQISDLQDSINELNIERTEYLESINSLTETNNLLLQGEQDYIDTIAARDATIADRDATIVTKNATIATRDNTITVKSAGIAAALMYSQNAETWTGYFSANIQYNSYVMDVNDLNSIITRIHYCTIALTGL